MPTAHPPVAVAFYGCQGRPLPARRGAAMSRARASTIGRRSVATTTFVMHAMVRPSPRQLKMPRPGVHPPAPRTWLRCAQASFGCGSGREPKIPSGPSSSSFRTTSMSICMTRRTRRFTSPSTFTATTPSSSARWRAAPCLPPVDRIEYQERTQPVFSFVCRLSKRDAGKCE